MSRVLQSLSNARGTSVRNTKNRSFTTDARSSRASSTVNPVKITKLSSGIRVATEERPGELATVGVWIDAGSCNENDQNSGTSNFLTHLGFNSDSKQKAQKLGVSLNSYTSRQLTAFVSQSLSKDTSTAVNLLAEAVQNKNFSSSDMDEARSSILKGLKAYKKDLDDLLYDYIHSSALQKSTLALSPLGESSCVQKIDSESLSRFVNDNYTGNRIVIAGSGHVKHEELVSMVDKAFSSIPSQSNNSEPKFVDYVGCEMRIRDDTIHDIHAIIGWESVGWTSPYFWHFVVLQHLIGSYSCYAGAGGQQLSSRLAEIFAHGHSFRPYGNTFEAFLSTFKEIGLFGLHLTASEKLIHDCVFSIFSEFQRLVTYAPKEEIERAKTMAKTSLVFPLEDPKIFLRDLSRQLLTTDKYLNRKEVISKIDEVSVKDFHKTLNTFFYDVDPVCVVQGPLEEFPDYNLMRSWTYWNRW